MGISPRATPIPSAAVALANDMDSMVSSVQTEKPRDFASAMLSVVNSGDFDCT